MNIRHGTMLLVMTLLWGCGSTDSGEAGQEFSAARRGNTAGPGGNTPGTAPSALSPEVAADLGFIREEEKMARDVYLALQQRWGLTAFSNIARSETQHMSAMLSLLDRYGVTDPVGSAPSGVFHDPSIQRLHDELRARGGASLEDALTVGALIEDFDIVDIRTRLASSPPADVAMVYENLMRGSRNHLRSFVGQLTAQGATYVPAYLTPEEVDEILSSRW